MICLFRKLCLVAARRKVAQPFPLVALPAQDRQLLFRNISDPHMAHNSVAAAVHDKWCAFKESAQLLFVPAAMLYT